MFAPYRRDKEQGFTLIELLVVVLIIGILAAIAVPMFLNQRKEAALASVKTDLRNAASAMENEMIKNGGKYLSYLPNYEHRSDGVSITLDKSKSSHSQFCLEGKTSAVNGAIIRYSSSDGGVLGEGQDCGSIAPGAGEAFNANLAGKKVLFLASSFNYYRTSFSSYGFGTVDFKENATLEDFEGYDVIAAFTGWHSPTVDQEALLLEAYNAGYKVITEGNDVGLRRPWMVANYVHKGAGTGNNMTYNKTGATGLNPTFPYTFTATAFDGDDSWACIRSLKPGSVAIATSNASDANNTQCITAVASTNGSGGRWFHMSKYDNSPTGGKNILEAAIDWLLI